MTAHQHDIPTIQVNDPDLIRVLVLNAKKEGGVPWVTGEEAGLLLGIPNNQNLNRKLSWLIQHGFIQHYSRSGKATVYWREDIEQLAPRLAKGDVQVPTKFS